MGDVSQECTESRRLDFCFEKDHYVTAQQHNTKNVLGMVLEKTRGIQRQGINRILLTIGRSDRRENKKGFHKANFHLLPMECFFLGKGRMQVVAHFCPKRCF